MFESHLLDTKSVEHIPYEELYGLASGRRLSFRNPRRLRGPRTLLLKVLLSCRNYTTGFVTLTTYA